MVGIVIVSHSAGLADGIVELARTVAGAEVPLIAAGGVDDPDDPFGTDAARIQRAIRLAASGDGVLVLMDLGSAVKSAEAAVATLEPEVAEQIRLCAAAPLVEGAVAAAVAAQVGGSLDDVAAEARNGLRLKAGQVGAGQDVAGNRGDGWVEARLTVANRMGLHARPAALFVQTAAAVDAEVLVINATTGAGPARARSLTEVATLGALQGHDLTVRARGPRAGEAIALLTALAERNFDESDVEPAPALSPPALEVTLGRQFDGTLRGLAAAPGGAVGPARRLRRGPPKAREHGDVETERRALTSAIERAAADVRVARDVVARQAGEEHAKMMDAQIALLGDDALVGQAFAAIDGGARAEVAWSAAVDQAAQRFAAMDDPYLRTRAEDVREVGRRISGHMIGMGASLVLRGPGILVARELGVADTAELDLSMVQGIAVATGSPTSHSAILARALGVPAVLNAGDSLLTIPEETNILVDGDSGTIVIEPDDATVGALHARESTRAAVRSSALGRADAPAKTQDGIDVAVFANIAAPGEAAAAVAAGADGVGLFRTEFLFMGRVRPPTEAEQVAAYASAAGALAGRTLVLRTLDAGADKPVPYLAQPAEENPFLGQRGIRLSLANPELFRTQLRAALRVAAGGHAIALMHPMVATVDELAEANEHLASVRAELEASGAAVPDVPVGVMIEVPSAALVAADLAEHAAFFSLGTNDLTQYTLAAERGNPAVSHLADAGHPAVMRLIGLTCRAAVAAGRPVAVCGEAAGDPALIPHFLAAGVRELSVAPPRIAEVKQLVRTLDLGPQLSAGGELH